MSPLGPLNVATPLALAASPCHPRQMGRPTLHSRPGLALCHAALLTWSLSLTGCDRFGSGIRASAPALTLSKAEPIASFVVVLCLDGPDMGTMYPEAMVPGTAAGAATADTLGVTATVSGQAGSRKNELGGYQNHAEQFGFELESAGPWSDQSGLRCAPPQTIEFELQPDETTRTVSLDWTVEFRTEFGGLFAVMDDVRANTNSVQVRRIRN